MRMKSTAPALMSAVALAGASVAGCGGQSSAAVARVGARRAPVAKPAVAPKPQPPALVVSPVREAGPEWRVVARVRGQAAAWEAERAGVTLLRFDQHFVRLDLHAGEGEPSGTWRYGARIEPSEIHRVVAAFNGGFKFSTGAVGWMVGGRVGVPLRVGRGSIVTYTDGTTAIGAWGQGVPAAGRQVYSVLQNLSLLVDHGLVTSSAASCIQGCWGATVGNADVVARSSLGVTQAGELVWAAGERLTPATLAHALVGAGVQRAVQLDINPDWVAGYLYQHGGSGPVGAPVVPEQLGIKGRFLAPVTRDFFAVVAR
jgi:hypothetical protein